MCEGDEVDFSGLAKGESLSGWWERETDFGEEGVRHRRTKRYLLFDDEDRPRAWTSDTPSEYSKEFRFPSNWAFGCKDYMDHPLVVGGETRSPSSARNTMGHGGCGESKVAIRADSRRVLIDSSFKSGQLCLDYHVLNEVEIGSDRRDQGSSGEDPQEAGYEKSLCFHYKGTSGILEVTLSWDTGEPFTSFYRRYDPENAQDEVEDEALAGPSGVEGPAMLNGGSQ